MSIDSEKSATIFEKLSFVIPELRAAKCVGEKPGRDAVFAAGPESDALDRIDHGSIDAGSSSGWLAAHGTLYLRIGGSLLLLALRWRGKRGPAGAYVEKIRAAATLALELAEAEYRSAHDALTGLRNHGRFQTAIRAAISNAIAGFERVRDHDIGLDDDPGRVNMGLLIFDIDNFKSFNDVFGHRAGDAVLEDAAAAVKAALVPLAEKPSVFRYGGEEFAVIAERTAPGRLMEIAETVRRAVESVDTGLTASRIGLGARLSRVTVSVGAAAYNLRSEFADFGGLLDAGANAPRLVERADLALYSAKQLGKNRCVLFDDISSLCGSVHDRTGGHALISLGALHGVRHGDEFAVTDSRYDGSAEVRSAATGKKIGVFPAFRKGVLRVTTDFGRFEKPLQDRIALCEIASEDPAVPVAPGDRCSLSRHPEPVLHDDSYCQDDPDLGAAASPRPAFFSGGYAVVAMLNFSRALRAARSAPPGSLRKFFVAISEDSLRKAFECDEVSRRSSDRAFIAFREGRSQDSLAASLARIEKGLSAISCGGRVFLSLYSPGELPGPKSPNDIERALRITDFFQRFYGTGEPIACYSADVHRRYAMFYYVCSDAARAFEELNACIERFGQSAGPKLYQNAGAMAMRCPVPASEAERLLQTALALDPGNATALANLGLLYAGTGRAPMALANYSELVSRFPDDPAFANNLAFLTLETGGDLEKAEKLSRRALTNCPPDRIDNYSATLATILTRLGREEEAAEVYAGIIKSKKYACAIDIYRDLAYTYVSLGRHDAAWEVLQKAKGHPGHARAANSLSALAQKIVLARRGPGRRAR